ncbi:MAG: hypothetical protein A3F82_05970 [Deltaproteobacteria bacterium RIFCSPLOWO2_12_FULL_44_12]|nr:MAG: hypothetical protein A2712_01335 [Deltaproteobacteria bacterium RIFCSPHIGHO2_01_FULL_43_49]OGQ15222.1 MAG: hypothetical protein A3D22_04140 [Deltaproteobacteria bacterium RIFCSPHIGHO2_02_FULL_44_53]OGQ27155.1 MAG: hypothetical protein A3D98_01925 [Deltaproteobacteria bacterium RIFCSPHIGHO2_12_FULL_44_21]OGQ31739.1 MAG: hypothetical protein A2979_05300 [Deltaproteobacteria bacterium RIFCSPLOWO2_01_FULL_45_74]OGQ42939.1 MAG: hypothetical protein A3I70_07605 [Deltaproteobacteria bacterium 
MLLSFLFDIPIFLPFLGFLILWLHSKKGWHFWGWTAFTLSMFWLVSGGLYFDLWGEGGNHFMWYSWLDKMGIVKTFPIPTPTFQNPYGFWNLFGFVLFLTYPFILIGGGKFLFWLKGILFGHIKGQTGLWGMLTNR